MLLAQALLYGAALGGYARRNAGRRIPLLSVPYVLCLLNCATFVGFLSFVTGRPRATWEHAARSPRGESEGRGQGHRARAEDGLLRSRSPGTQSEKTVMPWRNVRPFLFTAASVRQNAPAASGVYGICTPHEWIYIGGSQTIQGRQRQHLNGDTT